VSTGPARLRASPIDPPIRPRPMIAILPIFSPPGAAPRTPSSRPAAAFGLPACGRQLRTGATYILTEQTSACVVGGAEEGGARPLLGQGAAGDETDGRRAAAGFFGEAGAQLGVVDESVGRRRHAGVASGGEPADGGRREDVEDAQPDRHGGLAAVGEEGRDQGGGGGAARHGEQ